MATRELSSHMKALAGVLSCWIVGALLNVLIAAIGVPEDVARPLAPIVLACPFVYLVFLKLLQAECDLRQLKRWAERHGEGF
jgi:hypothetical protein